MQQRQHMTTASAKTWYDKGVVLHFDNYEQAIKCYDQAIAIDPRYTDAYAMKGTALSNNDRHLEAIQCYERVLAYEPYNTDILSRKATTHGYLKQYREAVELLEKVFSINPESMMYLNIVENLCELGRPADAVKACEKYLLHNVNERVAYSTKARVERDYLADFNQSLISYERFSQLLLKNNIEKIIINNSAPISTTNIRSIENAVEKTVALNALGHYQEALVCCNQALATAQKHWETHDKQGQLLFCQANIYFLLEQYDNALSSITHCEKLPDDKKRSVMVWDLIAIKGLIALQKNKNQHPEAERLFDDSLTQYNKSVRGLVGSGVVSLLKNKNAIADNYFKQAEEVSKTLREKLEVFFMIGRCCARAELYEYTNKFLEKAIQLKADYLPALLELKRLPDITTHHSDSSSKAEATIAGEASYKKAQKYYKKQEYQKALKHYKLAAKARYLDSQEKVKACEKLLNQPLANLTSKVAKTSISNSLPSATHGSSTSQYESSLLKISIEVAAAELKLGEKIGEGGFGIAYKGEWQGNVVAIKKLKIEKLSPESLSEFIREAQLMSQLRHPQVVNFYKICIETNHYAIVMEYCDKGSLYKWLRSSESENWNTRIQISIDVGKGLSYLHQHQLLHRDLKSLNVLLNKHLSAKITDFGLSKIKTETATTSSSTQGIKGTLRWLAPELINGKERQHSEKTDMYSYGMVLWEIAARKVPYQEEGNEMMVANWIGNGRKEDIPNDTPYSLAKLIGKCWEKRAEKRPTAKMAYEELESAKNSHVQTPAAVQSISSGYQANLASDQKSETSSNNSLLRHNLIS